MTSDREERLIEDVAWLRGKLESYFESTAPTLATKESVESIDKKIMTHLESHKDTLTIWPVWVGVVVSSILSVFALWKK